MSQVLATYNIKGGVGKTSAAVNLAYLASLAGHPTLLWDLDPQGASTYVFRVKPKLKGGGRKLVGLKSEVDELIKGTDYDRLDLLPADFSYRHMDLLLDATKRPEATLTKVLRPLRDDYDVAILDCAPSISLVSESVFDAADALLVPLIPATLSIRTFEQLLRFLHNEKRRQPDIIAFFSMVDRRKKLHRELVADLPLAYPSSVVDVAIPMASDVERMGTIRLPLAEFAPRPSAAGAYDELWRHTRKRLALP